MLGEAGSVQQQEILRPEYEPLDRARAVGFQSMRTPRVPKRIMAEPVGNP
jgi:hypothetical protein